MFTGIVTDIGEVRSVEKRGDTRFEILTRYDLAGMEIGASIAVSGPCLTVVGKGEANNPPPLRGRMPEGQEGASAGPPSVRLREGSGGHLPPQGGKEFRNWFAVQASAETLSKTTLGEWRAGMRVNLERPLKLGDEFGGHIVMGHIDGVAEIVAIKRDGESLRFTFEVPRDLARYIAPKGPVCLDGVSLTVNEVDGARFGVNVIPHTLKTTTFGEVKPGQHVNLEIDILARYVARLKDAA